MVYQNSEVVKLRFYPDVDVIDMPNSNLFQMITILFVLLGGYIVLITQSSYLLDLVNIHCIVRK